MYCISIFVYTHVLPVLREGKKETFFIKKYIFRFSNIIFFWLEKEIVGVWALEIDYLGSSVGFSRSAYTIDYSAY